MSNKTSNFVDEEIIEKKDDSSEVIESTIQMPEDELDSLDDLDLNLSLDFNEGQDISELDLSFNNGINLELTGITTEDTTSNVISSNDDLERLNILIKRAKTYLNDFSGVYTKKLTALSKKMTKEFVKMMEEYTPKTSVASSTLLQSMLDTEESFDIEDQSILQDETNYQAKCRKIRTEATEIKEHFASIISEITEDTVSGWVDDSMEDTTIVEYYKKHLNISQFFLYSIRNSTNFQIKLEGILKEFVIKAKTLYKDYGKGSSDTPLDLIIQSKDKYSPLRLMNIADIAYNLKSDDDQVITCPNCTHKQRYQTLLFTKSLDDLSAKQTKDYKFGHIPFLCEKCGQISALSESTLAAINDHLVKKFFGPGNTLLHPNNKDMLASPDSSFLRTIDEIRLIGDTVEIEVADEREMSVADIQECLQECEKYNILQYYESLLLDGKYAKCEDVLKANIGAFTSFKNIVQATFAHLAVSPVVKDVLDLLNMRDALITQKILLNQIKKNCEYFVEQSKKDNITAEMEAHIKMKMSNLMTAYISNGFTFLSSLDYNKNLKAAEKAMEIYDKKLTNVDNAIAATFEYIKKYVYDYLFNMQYYSTDSKKIAEFGSSRFFTLFKTQNELDDFMADAMSAVTMRLYTENFVNRDLTKANSMRRARWSKDEPIDSIMHTLDTKGFLAQTGSEDYFNPLLDVLQFITLFNVKNSDILSLYSNSASLGKAILTKVTLGLNLDNENLTSFYCLNSIYDVIGMVPGNNNNSLLRDLKNALDKLFVVYPELKLPFSKVEEKDYDYYVTLRVAGFSETEALSLLKSPRLTILRRKQNETIGDYTNRMTTADFKSGLKISSHDYESAELSEVRELLRLIYTWVDTIHENRYNKSPFLILTLKIKAIMKYKYTVEPINLLFDNIALKTQDAQVSKPNKLAGLLDLKRIIELLCDFDSKDRVTEKDNAALNDVMNYSFLLEPEKAEQYMFETLSSEFAYAKETEDFLTYATYVELYSMCESDSFPETDGMSPKDLETYVNYSCILNEEYRENSIMLNAYPELKAKFNDFDSEFEEFKQYLNTKYNLRR